MKELVLIFVAIAAVSLASYSNKVTNAEKVTTDSIRITDSIAAVEAVAAEAAAQATDTVAADTTVVTETVVAGQSRAALERIESLLYKKHIQTFFYVLSSPLQNTFFQMPAIHTVIKRELML